jgi:hypothetical protein
MTWAFEFAGMEVRYDSEGLMGRGLYVGKHDSKIRPGAGGPRLALKVVHVDEAIDRLNLGA